MHPNQAFRKESTARNIAFARDKSFGVLAVNSNDGPLLSHVPFLLDEKAETADLHLVRSNPILRLLDNDQKAVISIQGPDGYISPDWYGVEDQVPTWNYVAVHLRGKISRRPQGEIREVIDRLSAQFEARLTPKLPWASTKMTPEVLEKMMKMIVPCRLEISKIEGTWKLGQNKPVEARLGAAENLVAGVGTELASLSALMHDPSEPNIG